MMSARSATLRSKLLRWLLIPLSLLFLADAVGSHYIARHLSDRVYDGELLEIARELTLHVKPNGPRPSFDLEKDAERTLLLDQYDRVDYVVRGSEGERIAGDEPVAEGGQPLSGGVGGGVLRRGVHLTEQRRAEPGQPLTDRGRLGVGHG